MNHLNNFASQKSLTHLKEKKTVLLLTSPPVYSIFSEITEAQLFSLFSERIEILQYIFLVEREK